jgi:ElaB/YqjD/DUF883 family membrane-anchored ribosome-binding protein
MVATVKRNKRNMGHHPKRIGDGRLADLRDQAAVVGGDVRELAATAGDVALAQVEPIEDFVRDKPLKSVLIAAGIGALFGLIFLRR